MASSNTLYSQKRYGFVRIEDNQTNKECDYPLYSLASVPSNIDAVDKGAVVENAYYNLYILIPSQYTVSEISLSINGSDPVNHFSKQPSPTIVGDEEYYSYLIIVEKSKEQYFLLTYGFVRIEVILAFDDDISKKEIALTTKDIPCLSKEDYQSSMIAQILDELLDTENDTVTKWMFTGEEGNYAAFSILDAELNDNSPKSLSSIVQMFEAAIIGYERNYNYFKSHGFSRIVSSRRKLPSWKLRSLGSQELLWIAKNSGVLSEKPYETGIDYMGRYYLPREVETDVKIKSYDSYENRLILGFLNELLARAKTIYANLKCDITSVRSLEARLNPIKRDGYSFPALTLVRQCVTRENFYVAKLQDIIGTLQKLKRKYEAALPGVKAQFTRSPRRTKVFQEVKSYSEIFALIMQWLKFGDFTLARENLALHSLRLDKLYEYYVLFKMLCWFDNAGFSEDEKEETPIERVEYKWNYRKYNNEKRVATLYKLSHGDTRVRLYFQPVIYGKEQEEHGVTLHRLSRAGKRDSVWNPDFMLSVIKNNEPTKWHIFDAKFSKAAILWDNYPKEGPFTTMMSKYKTDICGVNDSDKISSLWLFCGREQGENLRLAECSSWAMNHYKRDYSGIGALTPSFSCLDEILGTILDFSSEKLSPKSSYSLSSDVPPLTHVPTTKTEQTKPPHVTQGAVLSGFVNKSASSDKCLPLITELYNLVEDHELLYKSRWAEVNLGIAHPLLRKSAPKGRERKFYAKAEVCGVSCYAYANWLPNYENKLRSYVEKSRMSS